MLISPKTLIIKTDNILTIITPVLNGARFIENNLKSIAELDIPVEHIVVDGGSTDGTKEIIKKYNNVTLIDEQGKDGMYAAIHQGFERAKGTYFAYVNADDEVIKSGFEAMYKSIIGESNRDLVYSNAKFYYEEENRHADMVAKRNAAFFLKNGIMPFVQPSSIYSKKLYFAIGGLRYETFKICGDLDMFQRMILHGARPYHVQEFSTIFLKYSGSLAAVSQVRKNKELTHLNLQPKWNKTLLKVLFKLNA